MTSENHQLHLGVNLHGAGVHPGSWRWPAASPTSFIEVDHYVNAAKVAERGLFDTIFLADRPSSPSNLAKQPPFSGFEPTVLLAAIARETSHIGLIATASTTYNDPFNMARRIQSLQLISKGRAAFNAVTTSDESTVASYGGQMVSRATRYARADAFLEAVLALWGSWGIDGDAVQPNPGTGRFANPEKLNPASVENAHFKLSGFLTLPGQPYGRPVVVQAGGSDEGMALAADRADLVFSATANLEVAIQEAERLQAVCAQRGRNKRPLILPGVVTIIGGTEAQARARKAELDSLLDFESALPILAGRLEIDPDRLALDAPIPLELLPEPTSLQSSVGMFRTLEILARQGLTARQIIINAQGVGHRLLVGSPEQVADSIAHWFAAGAADGFNILPDVLADGLPAFVDEVVPLLQRRGIFRTAYQGSTLWNHLGIEPF